VIKIDLPEPTVAEVTRRFLAAKEGKEGTPISDTPSVEVYGWLLEAGESGDLQKASDAFKRGAIIDKISRCRADLSGRVDLEIHASLGIGS
jgi:hypothetical protein